MTKNDEPHVEFYSVQAKVYRTIFAGRIKREVEFIGAKKMHHVKAGRKVMQMLTTILPSLKVVIFGTWYVFTCF